MELKNDFTVDVPVSEAWSVLTDLERIAPLMPGAQLQEVEGDEYRGVVKVKVGPITAQYKGVATFVERDEAAGKVVLKAAGRDTRGQGNATALITAQMTPVGEGTSVSVLTDLTITGKVAQFGRGVMAEVSGKLLGQFVDALHDNISSGGGAAVAPAADPGSNGSSGPDTPSGATASSSAETASTEPAAGSASAGSSSGTAGTSDGGVRRIDSPEAEPVDLFEVAGGSAAKRAIPLAVLGVVLLLLLRRRSKRRRVVLAEVLS
jgi:uncharacterized protein